MNLVIGGTGILGNAIVRGLPDFSCYVPARTEFDLSSGERFWEFFDCSSHVPEPRHYSVAYLCAGTKGYAESEGSRKAFRADVDGNIRLAKQLLKQGTFVVFISTDGVEFMAHTAYGRNRLLVEMVLVMQPNTAIVRPSRFSKETVGPLADFVIDIGTKKKEGLHCWSL